MYKIMIMEEYEEGFKDVFKPLEDLNHIIGVAVLESESSPAMVMVGTDGIWRRLFFYYKGRQVA